MIFTFSRQRGELARLLSLAERLAALYGERWRHVHEGYVVHAVDVPWPLPSFQPWAGHFSIREIHGTAYRDRKAFGPVIEATRAHWTEGTRFDLSWWAASDVPAEDRWGLVCVRMGAEGVSVELHMDDVRHWNPLKQLPRIISAGRLPLDLRQEDDRVVLCHLESGEEVAAGLGNGAGLRAWSCPLPGETLDGALARAEQIVDALHRGEVENGWGFFVPQTCEADDAARLALWERLVALQPMVRSYTVCFILGIRAAEAMESLRFFPGSWATRYWFGNVNLRDERGMPVGFEEDDPVATWINVGVETSPAGHRLVLESDDIFNRAPITRVTGLTFTDWEV